MSRLLAEERLAMCAQQDLIRLLLLKIYLAIQGDCRKYQAVVGIHVAEAAWMQYIPSIIITNLEE